MEREGLLLKEYFNREVSGDNGYLIGHTTTSKIIYIHKAELKRIKDS